ncbi:MAG: sulfite exporter TauE/SafE family protein [Armatimonadetes bacterium]|nr:sulfite exporter TauE/SafE family protein [Armatimonadota bacterium]
MPEAAFALIVFAGSVAAGLVGALTGLGGGVVIVPMLTFAFHVDFRYAAGASIISVIATSSAAASAYVKEGYTNLRIGMFLEIATTLGALGGALLAAHLKTEWLSALFGLVLLYSAASSGRSQAHDEQPLAQSDRLARRLRLPGRFPGPEGHPVPYGVRRVPAGFALMALAGALSGLLGIGSGAFKVLAMDRAMGIPFKVSTTTSNFMIGVTAAASAGVYFAKGFINPLIAGPVMLGVLAGATVGAHCLVRWRTPTLRRLFAAVLAALGVMMLWNGLHPNH